MFAMVSLADVFVFGVGYRVFQVAATSTTRRPSLSSSMVFVAIVAADMSTGVGGCGGDGAVGFCVWKEAKSFLLLVTSTSTVGFLCSAGYTCLLPWIAWLGAVL